MRECNAPRLEESWTSRVRAPPRLAGPEQVPKRLKGAFGPVGNQLFPPDFGAVVAHRTVAPLVVCSNHTSQIGVDSLISESDTGPEGVPPR